MLQPLLPQRPDVLPIHRKALQQPPEQVLVLVLDVSTPHMPSPHPPLEERQHAVRRRLVVLAHAEVVKNLIR